MKFYTIALLLIAGSEAIQLEHHHKHHHNQHHQSLVEEHKDCKTGLEMTADEMNYQMEMFSRTFNRANYDNAMKIAGELKTTPPKVKTWELYDASFSFPRVRRYTSVQSAMGDLEHFEDNLNTNITNQKLVDSFIAVAKGVQATLKERFHDGEFKDPAATDPKKE